MSSKNLKKGIVKCINPSTLQVTILGPILKGEQYHREKKVNIHCINVVDEFKRQAFEYLIGILPGSEVKFDDYDLGGSISADIFLGDSYINLELVRKGWAQPIKTIKPSHNFEDLVIADEKAAEEQVGRFKELTKEEKKIQKMKKKELDLKPGVTATGWIEEFNYELDFKLFVKEADKSVTACFLGVITPIIPGEHMVNLRNWISKNWLQRPFEFKIEKLDEKGRYRILDLNLSSLKSPLRKYLSDGWGKLEQEAGSVIDTPTFVTMRGFQEVAMSKRANIWVNFEGKVKNQLELPKESEYHAKVVEVHSGDSLFVSKQGCDQPIKLVLSHLKAPLMGGKNEEPRPFAWEGKELLRKLCIGKKVHVKIDGIRKIDREGLAPLELTMATVTLEDGKVPAVAILEEGLAQLNMPRPGDPTSAAFKEMTLANERAIKKQKGLHGKGEGKKRIWDFMRPENKKIAKEVGLENYKGKGQLNGVVEAVISASYYKIRFEQENCCLAFSLDGVKSLERNPNMPNYEKWSLKAIDFAKSRALQRDIKFEIESIDRHGGIHGQLLIGGKDFALELLSKGLVYINNYPREARRSNEYKPIEAEAKAKGAGFWGDGIQPKVAEEEEEVLSDPIRLICTCPEVSPSGDFYLRMCDQADQLESEIADLKNLKPAVEPLKNGTMLLGLFEGKYYRCKLLRADQKGYHVIFIDYGNEDILTLSSLKQCPQMFIETEPFAFKAKLEGLILPPPQSEFHAEAIEYIEDYLDPTKRLLVSVRGVRGGAKSVVISKENDNSTSLNVRLLERGLAVLDSRISKPDREFVDASKIGEQENPELVAEINNMD